MSRVDAGAGWRTAEPYLRGVAWRSGTRCVRADPADPRLPADATLRTAVEDAVRDRIAGGDRHLALPPGRDVLGPAHLPDGPHPDDRGHGLVARAVTKALGELLAAHG